MSAAPGRRHFNVMVAARDGVRLATDLYLPSTGGPHPAVLVRTPYNKNQALIPKLADGFNRRGYALAVQDCRGRGDSEGEFSPYRSDGRDGHDAVEWLAGQDWSDGVVATRGGSYGGRIQWLTALEKPAHLKAMVVMVTPSDPFVEFPTGPETPMMVSWFRLVDGRVVQNAEVADWTEVYKHLPLLELDERAGFRSRHWREALQHPTLDEFWQPVRYQHRLAEIDLPVLHVSGWYDDEQVGTPSNFAALSRRSAQRLLMGPWGHAVNATSRLGEIDFGGGATIDLEAYVCDWLDLALGRGRAEATPPVRIFVMGANTWRDEHEWPLARTEWLELHLHSGGGAQSRFGDGALTAEPPGAGEPPDAYLHDPARPVPFITEPTSSQLGGPDDYSAIQNRGDVLCYTSEPFEADTEVTGPITLHLHASTGAVDTDFMAMLCDVHPGGFAQRLCDSAVRLRYREGHEREVLAEPGTIYELTIDLWNTSQVFFAGHRVRLQVASSAFPKYDRNLGTGEPIATGTRFVRTENRVFHDPEHPSRLVLPVIPRA